MDIIMMNDASRCHLIKLWVKVTKISIFNCLVYIHWKIWCKGIVVGEGGQRRLCFDTKVPFFYFAWQFWKLASIVKSAPRPLQWPQPLTNMTILQIEHVQHINTTSKVSFSHQMILNFNISYILCWETIGVSIWFPDIWISTNYKFILKLFVLSIDLARTGIILPAARETTPIKNI